MPISGNCAELTVLAVTPRHLQDGRPLTFEVLLEDPGWHMTPGQFVMLRAESFGLDLIWGRPISIADFGPQGLRLFIQVAGRGTRRLAALAAGQKVVVWGPLGHGFHVDADKPTLLAAGGVGLAPFLGYLRHHPKRETLSLLFGHRLPPAAYPLEDFADMPRLEALREEQPGDLDVFIKRLEQRMAEHVDGLVLACGPMPFLRTVARLARQYKVRTQVSLEGAMGCGVGACLGCVVPKADGSQARVCVEGPVFDVDALDMEAPK